MEDAYEGGGSDGDGDAGDVVDGICGDVGAIAVCNTGFCTCVLFTDCIMIGGCVLACRAPHACRGVGRAIAGGVAVDTGMGLGEPAEVGPE